MPFEQSYFNAANLTGALAIVDAGISEDSDEMKKNLRQVVKRHTSQRCEYSTVFAFVVHVTCKYS